MNLTLIQLSPEELRDLIRQEIKQANYNQLAASTTENKYLAIKPASVKYGVSRSYLYRLSSERIISTRRVGKHIYFSVEELEIYFDKKVKKSQASVERELTQNGVFPTLKGKHRG